MNQLAVSSLQLLVVVPTFGKIDHLGKLSQVSSAVRGEKDIRTYVHKKRAWGSLRMAPFSKRCLVVSTCFYFHPNLGRKEFQFWVFFLHSLSTSFCRYMETLEHPNQKVSNGYWKSSEKSLSLLGKNKTNSASIWHVCSPEMGLPRDRYQLTNERLNLRWSLFSTHGLWQQAWRSSSLDHFRWESWSLKSRWFWIGSHSMQTSMWIVSFLKMYLFKACRNLPSHVTFDLLILALFSLCLFSTMLRW